MTTAIAAGLRPDLYFSADITKVDELDDGTVMVYGIPAMPGVLDNDQQMVDPAWLRSALDEWYRTGPNIREMHLPVAVGIGTELDWKDDVPYLTAHIVDPLAVKKVKAKVLRAFSIGIKRQVIKRIKQAAKGLIVGGKIIEVTLCDRPCIPGSDILDFKADVFKMAGYITDDEVIDWQRGVAWKCTPLNKGDVMSDTAALEKRDIDPDVGGGVDRDKIPAEDFAGKNRSYPIVKPGDVSDAASSIGRAGDDNYSSEQLKKNIIRIAKRKGAAYVAELPEAWKNDKETSKVADTDSTKTPEAGDETVAATESAADVTKTDTDLDPRERILADIEKASASSAYCAECDKSMPILDGKEQTVKGNRMLVGKDSAGHTLRKFVDVEKADEADEDGEKTVEAAEAKSDESDASKSAEAVEAKAADSDAEKTDDAEKGVIVVAPEHEAKPAEKSDEAETAKDDTAESEKTVEAPAVKADDGDVVKAALVSLLKDAGIDLAKIAQHTQHARMERLTALTDELIELGKTAQTGGPTTVTGLDADTAGRMRDCLAEINELAGQMTGTPADGDASEKGLDMGTATIASPSERIDMQKTDKPDLTKTSTTLDAVSTALDVTDLGKSLAAEFTKGIAPLVERLEQVEHSVKPASPPVLREAERGSPFINADGALAGDTAFKTAMESLQGLDDDTRAKVAAAWLASRPDSPLARTT